jgi:hypothetical protein
MYGDFSRLTFSAANHFSAVISQQGRVQVDADLNETNAINLHHLRTLIADLLGPAAGPAGNAGFAIAPATGKPPELNISSGRYYVDGLLCENDPPAGTTYWGQPDAFLDPNNAEDLLPEPPYLVYLLAWERLITAVESPAIREVALGDQAPDTTARAKVVWQVRAVRAADIFDRLPAKAAPADATQKLRAWFAALRGNAPMLRARTAPADPGSTDPCITPPQAGYRGQENQLYRVEVHTGNSPGPTGSVITSAPATFTWSRENGSVVFPITKIDKTEVFLASMGRDTRLGLEVGDWVEVVDDANVLRFEPTKLLQVMDLDIGECMVTLSDAPAPPTGTDPDRRPLLRRWDQREPAAVPQSFNIPPQGPDDNALQVQEGDQEADWIDLENGVQIQFQPGVNPQPSYWHGDYWLIPARTLTGDVEWPQDGGGPAWRPPHGVRYHVAPLAIVNIKPGPIDERCLFGPVACT